MRVCRLASLHRQGRGETSREDNIQVCRRKLSRILLKFVVTTSDPTLTDDVAARQLLPVLLCCIFDRGFRQQNYPMHRLTDIHLLGHLTN